MDTPNQTDTELDTILNEAVISKRKKSVQALIAQESAKAVEGALENIKMAISGASAMWPAYADLDREEAINTARKVALSHIDQAIATIKEQQ